jgi:hypothetical protein
MLLGWDPDCGLPMNSGFRSITSSEIYFYCDQTTSGRPRSGFVCCELIAGWLIQRRTLKMDYIPTAAVVRT